MITLKYIKQYHLGYIFGALQMFITFNSHNYIGLFLGMFGLFFIQFFTKDIIEKRGE